MPQLVYADEQDDIASLRTRLAELESAGDPEVAVVVPEGNRPLVSTVAVRLLSRYADELALEISLVSRDPALRRLAREEGLRVFGSPLAYRRAVRWETGPAAQVATAAGGLLGVLAALLRTVAVLGTVLLVAGLVYVLLPSATVTVAPRAEVVRGTVQVVADPDAAVVDAAGGRVPARVVYLLVEVSDQMAPGEGQESRDGRAVGLVAFINRNAQEMLVPQGTLVSTADGVRFRTSADVRLAGGLGQTGRVRVVAVEPGGRGNVPRFRINRVEGEPLQYYVLVQNDEPTAGGGGGAAPVVTADDRERLQARAQSSASAEALAKLAAIPRGRELLVRESFELTPLEVIFDHAIGDQASALGVRLKARAAATFVDQADVERLARQTWTPPVQPGFQLAPGGSRLRPPEVLKVEGRAVTLAAHLEATTLAQINTARVQQLARWRSPAEAERELARAFDLARPPVVQVAPAWAERAYRVSVVVDPAVSP